MTQQFRKQYSLQKKKTILLKLVTHKVFSLFLLLWIPMLTLESESKTISWFEAIALTKKNNSSLQAALKTFEGVQQLEQAAQSGFLPSINATLTNSQIGTYSDSNPQTYGAQLSLSQNIFSGFNDVNKVRLAKANTQLARANLRATRSSLSSELKNTFANLFFSAQYKLLTSDIVQRRKENLRNVQLQFDIGRENKGSLLLSQSYVEASLLDELTALHQVETSQESLRQFLDLPELEPVAISDKAFFAETHEDLSEKPDFRKLSLETSEVLILQSQELIADSTSKVYRSQFLPSLDLVGTYGEYDTKFYPNSNKWTVGLTLTIPLFQGGRDASNLRSSLSKLEASQLQTKYNSLVIENNLRSSFNAFQEATQKAKVDSSFLAAAEVRAKIARSKYKNGLINFDDWDLIENDLIARQKAALVSQKDRIAKQAAWEQARGQGVLNE